MSSTLNPEKAEWFARRWTLWGDDSSVYEATIPPKAVLAMFNDRDEQEVVVNPNMLRGRTRPITQFVAKAAGS